MVEPGRRTLGSRYELRSLLATGGMGQVWRGHDRLLGRSVAVKVLRSEYTGDPTFLARFRAEAQHAAALSHPNIAALYDYGETVAGDTGETLAYLVMELVEGEPLSDVLARHPRLDPGRVLDIVGQTAAALAAAHAAGVVHRDVKPGNVLVGDDGVVKITDFGIAWSASSVPLTQTGQVVGTAHYLSPEQAAGAKAGPASDVYALGMIAYECLAGRRAFDGESPVQIALQQLRDEPDPLPDDVPANVVTLVARALVKDPVQRFPDGAAFRDAVTDVLAGRTLPPVPPPPTAPIALPDPAVPPAGGRARRGSRLLVPLAALLAGTAIGMGAFQLLGAEDRPAPAAVADTAVPGVLVVPGDHLGRPVDEVEADLIGLGLRVERAPEETGSVPAGQVTGLTPVGELRRGDLVTVAYAVAPEEEPAPETVVPVPEPATRTVVVPSPSPVPIPVPAPPPAPVPAAEPDDEGEDDGGGDDGEDRGRGGDDDEDNSGSGNGGGSGGGRGRGNGD
ncbi:MAG TPA: protein kinase [Geodermatophilus sp.]|nr:protein kinase [Geodermatophilus sp.]